jgi:hypothetical protein
MYYQTKEIKYIKIIVRPKPQLHKNKKYEKSTNVVFLAVPIYTAQ